MIPTWLRILIAGDITIGTLLVIYDLWQENDLDTFGLWAEIHLVLLGTVVLLASFIGMWRWAL